MTETAFAAETESNEPIQLTWSQQLAASWLLFWPSWIASLLLVSLSPNDKTIENLVQNHAGLLILEGHLTFLLAQGILTFRLTRKNFRTFWIGVLHGDESVERRFALREQLQVWLRII